MNVTITIRSDSIIRGVFDEDNCPAAVALNEVLKPEYQSLVTRRSVGIISRAAYAQIMGPRPRISKRQVDYHFPVPPALHNFLTVYCMLGMGGLMTGQDYSIELDIPDKYLLEVEAHVPTL